MKSKKLFFYTLILSLPLYSFGQYEQAFKNGICGCLEVKGSSAKTIKKDYQNCFREVLPTYVGQVDASVTAEDASHLKVLRLKKRQELLKDFESQLIYNCDFYFKTIEKGRTAQLAVMRAHADEGKLKKINEIAALSPNAGTFLQRGVLHFSLENIKEAEEDFKQALEDNLRNPQANIMLAWLYEEQGNFTAAKQQLDKAFYHESQTDIALLWAIVNKKIGGSSGAKPQIENLNKNTPTLSKGKPVLDKKEKPVNRRDKPSHIAKEEKLSNRKGSRGSRDVLKKKDESTQSTTQKKPAKKEVSELFKRRGYRGGNN